MFWRVYLKLKNHKRFYLGAVEAYHYKWAYELACDKWPGFNGRFIVEEINKK